MGENYYYRDLPAAWFKTAPWWKFVLARVFGHKVHTAHGNMIQWCGSVYVFNDSARKKYERVER